MPLSSNEQYSLDAIKKFEKSSASPTFPVTPTRQITVSWFSDLWIKDESYNPTGTHKDRMAWQIVKVYEQILRNKQEENYTKFLPHFSLITAWSAGYAIQSQLQAFWLPYLKVIIDHQTPKSIEESLRDVWCETYRVHLGKKRLSTADILKKTKNPEGFDITSNKAFDPQSTFYDWLSYEVFNHNPNYVFVPYGSGHLYENIVHIGRLLRENLYSDPVYTGNSDTIKNCHIIWATSYYSKTRAQKLYSHFRPFVQWSSDYIRLLKARWLCGWQSNIRSFQEKYLEEAYTILKANDIQAEYSAAWWLALALQMRDHGNIDTGKKIIVVNTGKSKCA